MSSLARKIARSKACEHDWYRVAGHPGGVTHVCRLCMKTQSVPPTDEELAARAACEHDWQDVEHPTLASVCSRCLATQGRLL